MRKVLYSPDYGYPWTANESNKKLAKFLLEYAPIIEFVEAGNNFTEKEVICKCPNGEHNSEQKGTLCKLHPLLEQLHDEVLARFGVEDSNFLGAIGLNVEEVEGRVRIHVYDGSEYIEEEDTFDGWL